jgi:hypothetical protein
MSDTPPPGWDRAVSLDPGRDVWAWRAPDGRLAFLTPGQVPDANTPLVGVPPGGVAQTGG